MESFFSPVSSFESCFLSSLDLDDFKILEDSSDPAPVGVDADGNVVKLVELVKVRLVVDTDAGAAAVDTVGSGETYLRIHAERLNVAFSYFLMKGCSYYYLVLLVLVCNLQHEEKKGKADQQF